MRTIFAHIFKMTFWLFPLMCADLGIFNSMNGLILSMSLICALKKSMNHIVEH